MSRSIGRHEMPSGILATVDVHQRDDAGWYRVPNAGVPADIGSGDCIAPCTTPTPIDLSRAALACDDLMPTLAAAWMASTGSGLEMLAAVGQRIADALGPRSATPAIHINPDRRLIATRLMF